MLTSLEILDKPHPVYSIADERLHLSVDGSYVIADGTLLEFTPMQRRVLSALSSTPDIVVSPTELALRLYGYVDESNIQTTRVHLSSSRSTLGTELGDRSLGAFRIADRAGFYAVSSLNFKL